MDIQLLCSTIHNLIEARKTLRLAYGGMEAASTREEGLSAFDAMELMENEDNLGIRPDVL